MRRGVESSIAVAFVITNHELAEARRLPRVRPIPEAMEPWVEQEVLGKWIRQFTVLVPGHGSSASRFPTARRLPPRALTPGGQGLPSGAAGHLSSSGKLG